MTYGFLLDLDGTLYNGHHPIPHAAGFIEWLQHKEYPYLLVTNNSSRTPHEVTRHLLGLGIRVPESAVFTSSQAAALHLGAADSSGKRRVYAIGEAGLMTALAEAGFELTETDPDYVVQGIDREFTYTKLAAAVKHIRAGAPHILTNPDLLLPWNGELTPGAGSIAASIQASSQAEPVVIGKPSPVIMNLAIARLGLPAERIWAVGDNMLTDIRGGAAAGCRTALVLTGLATKENAAAQIAAAGVQPDVICDDLAAFRELLEQLPANNV
ncbi:HAD-IIA family hydrolase [Paenibacillus thalictri]|uniref:Acid sugar phosphatase n=1 Tax=Paenibacillus thalictri TaxID=2527873 RepID=A0A4Q9E2G2_9BACL|nr:HAD-IIA family hydrolase [Paenibacillus thalictri]TBL81831.1 HAD-IIA family hydrolase [Paenibacillus thalictri]